MLKQLSILFLVMLAACCTGCSDFPVDPIGGGGDIDVIGGPIPFETIVQRERYGSAFHERTQIVVQDQAAWESLWKEIHTGLDPMPEVPAVDFNASTVVAVFQGTQLSGGYSIDVTDVAGNEQGVQVSFLENVPHADCPTTAVITSPYHIVKMPKVKGDISFSGTTVTRVCN